MDRAATGLYGEDIAVRYLAHQGYVILARRWRTRFGEIDVIAKKNNEIVFVEVKTRATASFGAPEDSVTLWKRRRLRLTAYSFLQSRNLSDASFRIDVIAVTIQSGRPPLVWHLQSAVGED